MFASMAVVYILIKAAFLAGLIKAAVSSEDMGRRPLLLAAVYTLGIGALSFVFFNPEVLSSLHMPWPDRVIGSVAVDGRVFWLGTTFLITALYFWLLARFENAGMLWWSILLGGVLLIIWW